MRIHSFCYTIPLVLLSSTALAQSELSSKDCETSQQQQQHQQTWGAWSDSPDGNTIRTSTGPVPTNSFSSNGQSNPSSSNGQSNPSISREHHQSYSSDHHSHSAGAWSGGWSHRGHVTPTKSPVYYTGSGFTGTAQVPASLSTVLFPTNSVLPSFPGFGSGRLGQNNLPQASSNGDSPLGTSDAPVLSPFIGSSSSGSDTSGAPWGNLTAQSSNPYTSAPNTGVTRYYNFNIARGILAPDGVEREMLLVNNQFPGPTIEANWGDMIQVTLTNSITGPEEGTALHWHGMLQTNTGYEDGIPGITQCPLAPGQTFTYTFQADLYGSSWWHSHFSAQYAGGVIGALIVHGPDSGNYDKDLGPILLTDYFHQDYYTIVEEIMGTDLTKIAPASQNNLINGKGNFNCSLVTNGTKCTPNAGLSKFHFTSGQTHRLRLINGGAEGIQRFSVDDHLMEVIAYDFVPIESYTTNQVTLAVGQRADVLIKANGSSTSSYWMRSSISSLCSLSNQPDALAIIYYENANTTAEPTSTCWPIHDSVCANDPLSSTVPLYPIQPPSSNTTIDVSLSFEVNSTGNFLWTLDGSSFRTDYNNPILPQLEADNSSATIASFPREWNVYNFGSNKSFIIVINNQNAIAHPMHIHGHNMFVLSEGPGSWDGKIQGSASNPARRDVQILQPNGYIALQIDADNPGVWPFHCHIAWHVSGGLYMNILERPADIPSLVKTPSDVAGLCTSWDAFTNSETVNQIDSGLRRARRGVDDEVAQPWSGRRRDHLRRHVRELVRHSA